MKKIINDVHIEGRVYACNLEKRVTGENSKAPGTEYIRGNIQVATDEEGLNVVTYYVTYLTQKTSKGTENASYTTLNNLLNVGKTWSTDGKDAAMKVRIDCSINVNDFISRDGQMVSQQRAEGGFIHLADNLNASVEDRTNFKVDTVITSVALIEGNPEIGTKNHADIKGCTFDFRGALIPVTFTVEDPNGINYFMGLGASNTNPVFTKVWGPIVSQNIVKEVVEQSAFGGDSVTKTTSSRKVWLVTHANPAPYAFPAEDTLTADELKAAIAAREVTLAAVKQRNDERASAASPSFGNVAASAAAPATGDFKF